MRESGKWLQGIREVQVAFRSRFTMFDRVRLQSPCAQHKEWAMVRFRAATLHPVIMFYEQLGSGKDGMGSPSFQQILFPFSGKTDTLAYFVFKKKKINFYISTLGKGL